eukprot:7022807-Pyramimonas_sp.AAC.1
MAQPAVPLSPPRFLVIAPHRLTGDARFRHLRRWGITDGWSLTVPLNASRGQVMFRSQISPYISWWVDLNALGATFGDHSQEAPNFFNVLYLARTFRNRQHE